MAFAAAYFVSGYVGLQFPYFESTVTLIWAPTGVTLAALLCWGLKVWPGAAIGAFAVNLTTGVPFETVALITAGNTLSGVVGAALLHRFSRGPALDTPGTVLRFLVLGVAVSPLISSLNGAAALCLTLLPSWDGFAGVWRGWWIGDAMGVLLFAPPLLQLARRPWRGRSAHWCFELGLIALCAAAISILVHRVDVLARQEFLFIFVSLPFALWGVVRFGGLGAAVVNLTVCLTAIGFLTAGRSFFIVDDPQESLLRFYGFFSVVGVASLILAAFAETALLHDTADPEPAQSDRIRRIRIALAVGCGGLGLAISIAAATVIPNRTGTAGDWPSLGILMVGALLSGGLSLYLLSLTRAEERITRLVLERSRLLQRARLEAEAAMQQAQQASHAKSEFLAQMSHELRSPLNAILGYAELALNDPQSQGMSPQARAFIETIIQSGRHLAGVIGDTLDLSAIEAGRFRLNRVPFDLRDVAREAVAIMASSAEANRNGLTLDVDPAVPGRVVGDPVRVRQVMLNFLSNAAKFTADGSIRLTVESLADTADRPRLRVCVTDSGVGIAESRHAELFRTFGQGDMSTTRAFGGTGLGLAISKRLVEAMGGEIGFRSVEGTGSAFWFDVSLDRADPEPTPERAAEAAVGPRPLSLLLVEDVEINRMLAERLLENAGHTVVSAGNGAEALEAIERQPFDAVVMDIQMPVLDGVEAAKRIRQMTDPLKRNVPIVALTANVAREDVDRYRAAGIDECCAKPLVMEVLSPIL